MHSPKPISLNHRPEMFSSFRSVNAFAREEAQSPLGSVNTQSSNIYLQSRGRQSENSSSKVSPPWTKPEAASAQTHVPAPILPPNQNVSNLTQSSEAGVPSTETGSNSGPTQRATFAANQPSPPKPGLHKRVSRAKADFTEYLQQENIPCHFLSIDSPNGPLRRKDGDWITSESWANHIHDNFEWDNDSNRWRFGSNGIIVTEDQIYDMILSYQRALPCVNEKAFFGAISRSVEGVQWRDVKKARQLWKEHGLGSLDMADDSLWGGERRDVLPPEEPDPAATYDSEADSSTSSPGLSQSSQSSDAHLVDRSSQSHGKLHPSKPDTIQVGMSEDKGKDVWLRFVKRTNGLKSVFYDHSGQTRSEHSLQIRWHHDFRYSNFTTYGDDRNTVKRNQRQYIYGILRKTRRQRHQTSQSHASCRAKLDTSVSAAAREEKLKRKVPPENAMSGRSSLNTSDKRRQRFKPRNYEESDLEISGGEEPNSHNDKPRDRRETKAAARSARPRGTTPEREASDDLEIVSTPIIKPSLARSPYNRSQENNFKVKSESTSDPAQTTGTNLPSNVIEATCLLVSLSNQPDQAPANVPLSECLNAPQLFETLITELELKGKAASELRKVSVKYTWDQKRHLIRKDRPREWTIFVDTLRKAWERDATRFAEDGCEVEMLVHVGS